MKNFKVFSILILFSLLSIGCGPGFEALNHSSFSSLEAEVDRGVAGETAFVPVTTTPVVTPPSVDQGPAPSVTKTSINTQSKAAVIDAYRNWHSAPVPAMEWTGSTRDCVAGNVSVAYQQRVIDQINYYRAMAGLNVVELDRNNEAFQEGALILAANGRISHHPDDSWKCFSQKGLSGTSSSNIVMTSGMSAIWAYIDDWGSHNERVGHRRWLFHKAKRAFAVGQTPSSNLLGVFGRTGNYSDVDYVAWPSAGYIPAAVLPSRSQRWSFSVSGANFSEASVVVKNITDGKNYEVVSQHFSGSSYAPAIVFTPKNFNYRSSAAERVIEVSITNVKVNRETKNYTYQIKIINP